MEYITKSPHLVTNLTMEGQGYYLYILDILKKRTEVPLIHVLRKVRIFA